MKGIKMIATSERAQIFKPDSFDSLWEVPKSKFRELQQQYNVVKRRFASRKLTYCEYTFENDEVVVLPMDIAEAL
jgi:hypothetical protein